jgi:hypothetical protein
MTQTTLFSRPSPSALFRAGSQNFRVYERLLAGPVSNVEIVKGMEIFNSTGRASDIRKALKPYLMDVEAKPDPMRTGVWVYKLVG